MESDFSAGQSSSNNQDATQRPIGDGVTQKKKMTFPFLTDKQAQPRIDLIRSYVAKPIPRSKKWNDANPALVEGTDLLIGNRHHASRVGDLVQHGVTAVLNCASGGISRLPMDELQQKNIAYYFTNVRQDDVLYPILFDKKTGEPSKHLQVAKALYAEVRQSGGRVLFFCVAGQNRCVHV